jgi:hypothetical protein
LLLSFEDALQDLKSDPKPHNNAALQSVFDKYKSTYEMESRKLAESVTQYPIDEIKERIKKSASDLRQQAVTINKRDWGAARSDKGHVTKCKVQLSKCPEVFGELLGLVCASWTFLDCKGRPRSKEVECFDLF